jgi:hypothetical protein
MINTIFINIIYIFLKCLIAFVRRMTKLCRILLVQLESWLLSIGPTAISDVGLDLEIRVSSVGSTLNSCMFYGGLGLKVQSLDAPPRSENYYVCQKTLGPVLGTKCHRVFR